MEGAAAVLPALALSTPQFGLDSFFFNFPGLLTSSFEIMTFPPHQITEIPPQIQYLFWVIISSPTLCNYRFEVYLLEIHPLCSAVFFFLLLTL